MACCAHHQHQLALEMAVGAIPVSMHAGEQRDTKPRHNTLEGVGELNYFVEEVMWNHGIRGTVSRDTISWEES